MRASTTKTIALLVFSLMIRATNASDNDCSESSFSRQQRPRGLKQIDGTKASCGRTPLRSERGLLSLRNDDLGNTSYPRYTAGYDARPGQYPSYVMLVPSHGSNLMCSGVLIHSDLVLSARHCYSQHIALQAHLGVTYLDNNPRGATQKRRIKKACRLRDWPLDDVSQAGDIVDDLILMKLDRPVDYTDYVQPACLHFQETQNYEVFYGVGMGAIWFRNITDLIPARKLRVLPLKLDRRCRGVPALYASRMESRNCYWAATHRGGPCVGDSGGPLYFKSRVNSKMLVVGITSVGPPCLNDAPYWSMYADLYKMRWKLEDALADCGYKL